MDTFERNAARALAVAYHAYMNAGADNWQAWAKLLIQAQRDTGVELLPVSQLLYEPAGAELEALIHAVTGSDVEVQSTRTSYDQGDGDGDGGALVPAPKPSPRKPSPGASVASQAARFYALRR